MTTRDDLLRLADRVEREPASPECDESVFVALFSDDPLAAPGKRFTSSVDAAKSIEREEWTVDIAIFAGRCLTEVRGRDGAIEEAEARGDHAEPRARTAAYLRATAAARARAQGGGNG